MRVEVLTPVELLRSPVRLESHKHEPALKIFNALQQFWRSAAEMLLSAACTVTVPPITSVMRLSGWLHGPASCSACWRHGAAAAAAMPKNEASATSARGGRRIQLGTGEADGSVASTPSTSRSTLSRCLPPRRLLIVESSSGGV